jgi:uncharacterized protein (DUF433 family)
MALATAPAIQHIGVDNEGDAWIAGTSSRVVEVVLDWLAYGWSPAEIHLQHPHLSLAQVHAAFSYYYDHQAELDAQIDREHVEVAQLRSAARESPFALRMRGEGRFP